MTPEERKQIETVFQSATEGINQVRRALITVRDGSFSESSPARAFLNLLVSASIYIQDNIPAFVSEHIKESDNAESVSGS